MNPPMSDALYELILAVYAWRGSPIEPVDMPKAALDVPGVQVHWAPLPDKPWVWVLAVETPYTQVSAAFAIRWGRGGKVVTVTDPDEAARDALSQIRP